MLGGLAAAGLLAACGSAAPTKSATTSSASHVPGVSSASAAHPVTVTFLNVGAGPQTITYFDDTVIPGFEKKYPHIKVEMETSGWGSAFAKITTAVAAKTEADVFVQGGIWLGTLAADHALLPLNRFIAHWSGRSSIPAAVLASGVYDGTQYAIPYYSDVRGLWYNEADLKAAHISSPPTTLAELKADAAKLTVRGAGGTITREGMDWAIDNSIGLQQAYTELLYSMGGHEFNTRQTAPDFTSATAKAALQYLVSFFKDGYSSTSFVDIGSNPPPIALGKAAMEVNGFTVYTAAKQYNPSILKDLRWEPFPTATGKPEVALSFPTKLGIYAGTKHPNASWDFLSYLLTPKVDAGWDATIGELPTVKGVSDLSPWNTPAAREGFALEKIAKAQPVIPVMLKLGLLENTELDEAIYGKISPSAALDSVQSQVAADMRSASSSAS